MDFQVNFKSTPEELKKYISGKDKVFDIVKKIDTKGKDINLYKVRNEFLKSGNDVILFDKETEMKMIKFLAHYNIREFYFRNIGYSITRKSFFVWFEERKKDTDDYKIKFKEFKAGEGKGETPLISAFKMILQKARKDGNKKLETHILNRLNDIQKNKDNKKEDSKPILKENLLTLWNFMKNELEF